MANKQGMIQKSGIPYHSLLSILRHHTGADITERVIRVDSRRGLIRVSGINPGSGGVNRYSVLILDGEVTTGI